MNSATLAVPTLEERRPRSNGATEQQDDENTAMIDEDEEQVEAEEAEDKEVGRVGERDAEDGRSVVSDRYDFEVTRLSRDATRYSVRVKEGGRTTVPKVGRRRETSQRNHTNKTSTSLKRRRHSTLAGLAFDKPDDGSMRALFRPWDVLALLFIALALPLHRPTIWKWDSLLLPQWSLYVCAVWVVLRLLYLCYASCQVVEETVCVHRGLGIQLSTRFRGGGSRHRFIDLASIEAVVLNEGIQFFSVLFYMAFMVRDLPSSALVGASEHSRAAPATAPRELSSSSAASQRRRSTASAQRPDEDSGSNLTLLSGVGNSGYDPSTLSAASSSSSQAPRLVMAFEHLIPRLPVLQFMLHDIHQTLGLDNRECPPENA
eukprot:CAMPEP_0177649112 /NCGR_PEP_ID=MMETSP0447-20121125/11194_1 /TAXON_ID=0 /ORGANISM="Stygamoeba regulata, Strain BSH-02190019" /LENGTH=373 /DNA_ID=CAMNT_0019151811 /DNA_START=68 /DNA_END=1189 /DNA_ORIENTATION=-